MMHINPTYWRHAGRAINFQLTDFQPKVWRFHVRPKVITAAQIASPYDVTFLSVKSYNLAGAIDDFAPAVGPRTVIIPVLNGMRHIDVLTERFGKDAVLGGVCYGDLLIGSVS